MQSTDVKIESWKKKLLDLGKRNRLINFKETKRSNLNILSPSMTETFDLVVHQEKDLFFSYPIKIATNAEENIFELLKEDELIEDTKDIEQKDFVEGDFVTNQTPFEQQKTLKSLRNKAKTTLEEQGVNVLYLAFGFLKWTEIQSNSQSYQSPIILVPVTLTVESLTSPYKLQIHDDEIVVNPSLKYKLENDYNIILPEFNSETDDIQEYLEQTSEIFAKYNWLVQDKVSLSLFSFLKMNMYMDLHKHGDVLANNFAIKALCGDVSEMDDNISRFNNYDHDNMQSPINVYQTVDADSSQQDAILLSKEGVSFVLQGPPGTGKSQTITNIISQALADGKKVLFVSEKMAALEVVYRRLDKAGLSDFCLTLHNHKANKKEILSQLSKTLNLDKIKITDEINDQLDTLKRERTALNEYAKQLHLIHEPMNKSIYQVNGILAKLQNRDV